MTVSDEAPYAKVRMHHTGITVFSLDTALEFYRDLLGFELLYDVVTNAEYVAELVGYPHVELRIAMLLVPGTDFRVELLEYRHVEKERVAHRTANPGIVHLALQVDDVDGLYRRLTEAGVAAVSPPVTAAKGPNRGARLVYVIDPDGVRLELIQARPDEAPEGGDT